MWMQSLCYSFKVSKGKFWRKFCVFILQVTCFFFFFLRKRKRKSIGVLTLRYSFHSVLPWWRHWEYSPLTSGDKPPPLCFASLRATGTCNCIAPIYKTGFLSEPHSQHRRSHLFTEKYLNALLFLYFIPRQCGWWNTGSPHNKYRSAPFETGICWQRKRVKESQPHRINSWNKALLKWVRVFRLTMYIFIAFFFSFFTVSLLISKSNNWKLMNKKER